MAKKARKAAKATPPSKAKKATRKVQARRAKASAAKSSTASRAALKRVAPAARKKAKAAKPKVKRSAPKPRVARIDPLNRSQYTALTSMLIVKDVHQAIRYYADVFGFIVRGVMSGPDGNPLHAEMRARDTTLMLGPEMPERGALGPKSLGGSPSTLYFLVENVDSVTDRAVAAGGVLIVPVNDAFWGDRYSMVVDPEGHQWMIATHVSEPTPEQMAAALRAMGEETGGAG